MRIGVISDTHNYFDPAIPKMFEGVDHILHAGDVGLMSIIHELESIAPVTAVFGNTDDGLPIKETEIIELGGKRFLVHHIVDVHRMSPELAKAITKQQPAVVVFGHTHKPFQESVGNVLYFNPGYAGKQRFQLPRSVAVATIGPKGLQIELKWL